MESAAEVPHAKIHAASQPVITAQLEEHFRRIQEERQRREDRFESGYEPLRSALTSVPGVAEATERFTALGRDDLAPPRPQASSAPGKQRVAHARPTMMGRTFGIGPTSPAYESFLLPRPWTPQTWIGQTANMASPPPTADTEGDVLLELFEGGANGVGTANAFAGVYSIFVPAPYLPGRVWGVNYKYQWNTQLHSHLWHASVGNVWLVQTVHRFTNDSAAQYVDTPVDNWTPLYIMEDHNLDDVTSAADARQGLFSYVGLPRAAEIPESPQFIHQCLFGFAAYVSVSAASCASWVQTLGTVGYMEVRESPPPPPGAFY
jgi:hypothetical protein